MSKQRRNTFSYFKTSSSIGRDALPPIPPRKRKAIISALFWESPHPKFQARYNRLLSSRIQTLPKTSESGPRKSGPIAKAKTKIDRVNYVSTSVVTPRSLASWQELVLPLWVVRAI